MEQQKRPNPLTKGKVCRMSISQLRLLYFPSNHAVILPCLATKSWHVLYYKANLTNLEAYQSRRRMIVIESTPTSPITSPRSRFRGPPFQIEKQKVRTKLRRTLYLAWKGKPKDGRDIYGKGVCAEGVIS